MLKNKIEFLQNEESGYCFTPCPYGRNKMVNSSSCSNCIHNFGIIRNELKIKCTGHRI